MLNVFLCHLGEDKDGVDADKDPKAGETISPLIENQPQV